MPKKTAADVELTIDDEFQMLLPRRNAKEVKDLHANVLADGRFTDPILVWGPTNIVLDGHGRLDLWNSLPDEATIPPPVVEWVELPDRDAASKWIIRHQLGKRNLSPRDATRLRGKLYNAAKKPHGDTARFPSAQIEHLGKTAGKTDNKPSEVDKSADANAAATIAAETGVSQATVRRDGAYVEALDAIGSVNAKAKSDLESGALKVSKQDVIAIATLDPVSIARALKNVRHGKRWNDDARPAPNGRAVFDDRKVEDEFGKLTRLLNDRRESLGMGLRHKGYLAAHDALSAAFDAWHAWQKETP